MKGLRYLLRTSPRSRSRSTCARSSRKQATTPSWRRTRPHSSRFAEAHLGELLDRADQSPTEW